MSFCKCCVCRRLPWYVLSIKSIQVFPEKEGLTWTYAPATQCPAMLATQPASLFLLGCSLVVPVPAVNQNPSLESNEDYMYVLEGMALALVLLLASNCWFLNKTQPSLQCGKDCAKRKPFRDAAVQCDFDFQSTPLHQNYPSYPDGEIIFAQHSVRWHVAGCRHLKSASTKLQRLTPCLHCSPRTGVTTTIRWHHQPK